MNDLKLIYLVLVHYEILIKYAYFKAGKLFYHLEISKSRDFLSF